METKILITVDEAQKMLGVGRSKMYELAHTPDFPVVHIGRRVFIHAEKLAEWVEKKCATHTAL